MWFSLLIEFGKKTTKQNTAKNKFIGTFVSSLLTSSTVVIIVPKWVALVWRKIDFGHSIWPDGNQRNHCVYDSKLPWTRVLKEFLVQGWQQSFCKFSVLLNIPDLESDVFEQNIHQLSAMFTCRDGKANELSSRASKILYKKNWFMIFVYD